MASGLYLPEDHPDVVNSKQDFDPIDRFLWAGCSSPRPSTAARPSSRTRLPHRLLHRRGGEGDRGQQGTGRSSSTWRTGRRTRRCRRRARTTRRCRTSRTTSPARLCGDDPRPRPRRRPRAEALRDNGLEENTLVSSPRTTAARATSACRRQRPYRGWKITFFEGGIRVPFFVKWPARLAGGQDVRRAGPPLRHLRHGRGRRRRGAARRSRHRRRRPGAVRIARRAPAFRTSCSGARATTGRYWPTAGSCR
jgi:hypothetical protein